MFLQSDRMGPHGTSRLYSLQSSNWTLKWKIIGIRCCSLTWYRAIVDKFAFTKVSTMPSLHLRRQFIPHQTYTLQYCF